MPTKYLPIQCHEDPKIRRCDDARQGQCPPSATCLKFIWNHLILIDSFFEFRIKPLNIRLTIVIYIWWYCWTLQDKNPFVVKNLNSSWYFAKNQNSTRNFAIQKVVAPILRDVSMSSTGWAQMFRFHPRMEKRINKHSTSFQRTDLVRASVWLNSNWTLDISYMFWQIIEWIIDY